MPYEKPENLPDAVKALPAHGQEIWMAAFNNAWKEYAGDEERCIATAWAAVKSRYEKTEDGWKEKVEAKLILKEIPKEAPEDFVLLPMGKIEIRGEDPAVLDQAGADSIINIFSSIGNEMVIDYEHQTLGDKEAPAAGWIRRLYKDAQGLRAAVSWTDRAKQFIQAREYRYFSPVMWIEAATRRVVAVENVALTNFPKIKNLRPLVAKAISSTLDHPSRKEEATMLEKLKKLLGLAADAAETKVEETVTLLVGKAKEYETKVKSLETMVACKEVIEALGAKATDGKDEVLRLVASLKVPGDVTQKLSLEVARLSKELAEMKKQDLVQLALKEGKTSPKEIEDWAGKMALENPDQFKVIVLSRPAGSVIPIGGIPPGPPDHSQEISDVQKLLNKMCGVKEETFKKYQKIPCALTLAADKKIEYKEGVECVLPVYTLVNIYSGAFVCVRADGYAVPGDDASGYIFMGIARENADNSGGQSGDINILVRRRGLYKMTFATAITIANVGDNVFLASDETVDVAGNCTYDIFCGIIAEYIDTTHAWVDIEPAIKQADVATHIADTSAAHAASAISIADAGNFTTTAQVEAALQEIYQHLKSIQGFIPIPLTAFRELSSGVILNIAGNGGVLASDTTPILTCIADGDALRIAWAAGNADQIAATIILPPDIDVAADAVVHMLCSKDGNTNNAVHMDGEAYFGESDTDCFPAAGASNLLVQAKAEYTATIALADLPANQTNYNMTLVLMPEAHANDAVYLHAAWIEYKKKILTS